ncbi:MAG: hypothetical protein H6729_00315 [Deltaproteobacteria bacterium]|nr:hypothetical protein [Deltaproteobacteria bacterium]
MKVLRQVKMELSGPTKKVYEVDLVEISSGRYLVNLRYGRATKRLQESTKTIEPVNARQAGVIFDDLVMSKVAKGYVVVSDGGPGIPSLQALTSSSSAPGSSASPGSSPAPGSSASPGSSPAPGSSASSTRSSSTGARAAKTQAILAHLASSDANARARALWQAGEHRLVDAIGPALASVGAFPINPRQAFGTVDYASIWAIAQIAPRLDAQHAALNAARQALVQCELAYRGASIALIAQAGRLMLEDVHDPSAAARFRAELAAALSTNLANPANLAPLAPLAEESPDAGALAKAIEDFEAQRQAKPIRRAPSSELGRMRGSQSYAPPSKDPLSAFGDAVVLLYVIDRPHARDLVVRAARTLPVRYPLLQMFRRLLKLSELRRDPTMFGVLCRRLFRAKNHGDGFSKASRSYFNRRLWRVLRRLGEAKSPDYTKMASGVLLAWRARDAHAERQRTAPRLFGLMRSVTYYGPWARFLTLNHILYRNSPRFEQVRSGRVYAYRSGKKPTDPTPSVREEAFPQLWDADPDALTALVLGADLEVVHAFAIRALRAHRAHPLGWPMSTLASVLRSPFDVTARFGLEIAEARFDPAAPDPELIIAVANGVAIDAQTTAERWIKDAEGHLLTDASFWRWLLLSANPRMRHFAKAEVLRLKPSGSVRERILIGVVAELLAPDQKDANFVTDVVEILGTTFADILGTLDFEIVCDLAEHPLLSNQVFAARILAGHARFFSEAPERGLASLLRSKHAEVRTQSLALVSSLPDARLIGFGALFAGLLAHTDDRMRRDALPIALRLAKTSDDFARTIVEQISRHLVRPKLEEAVKSDVAQCLLSDFDPWLDSLTEEGIFELLRAPSKAANQVAGVLLRRLSAVRFRMTEIVALASHDVLSVREAAWKLVAEDPARTERELVAAVRMLDAEWLDSRQYAETFFRDQMPASAFTPDVLVSIMDSYREEVQQYGQALIMRRFDEGLGPVYLAKLAEHPSGIVQAFVSALVLEHVGADLARLAHLRPYFLSVLSRVNKGGVAKARAFEALRTASALSSEHAAWVASILTETSVTISRQDRAQAIQILNRIRKSHADVNTQLVAIEPEVRGGV